MWPAPEPGDVVWCRFPEKQLHQHGPKTRPALVITVAQKEGGCFVIAAYGTSQKLDRIYPGEFAIIKNQNLESYKASGLSYDTKFDLNNFVILPWGIDFFEVAPGPRIKKTPKLGALQGTAITGFYGAAGAAQLGQKVAAAMAADNLP